MRRETAGLVALVAIFIGACSYNAPDTPVDSGPLPTVGFAPGAIELTDELQGDLSIPVVLSEAGDATVDFKVSGGSARRPDDFTLTDGTLSFSGTSSASIDLTIVKDALEEPDETIELELVNPVGATLGTNHHTITISSDILPRVSIQNGSVSTMENVTAQSVTLHLDLAPKTPVGVQLTVAGTATAADHDLVTQTVMFGVGVTDVAVPFTVNDDALDEFDESIDMSLQTPIGLVIDPSGATASHVILDDDAQPTVAFVKANQTNGEATANADQTVKLSAPSGKTVTVSYSVTAGAAALTDDFTLPAVTTLTFLPGEDTKTIPISVVDDTLDELNETATISLAVDANSNADLGTTPDFVLTITDNDNPPDVGFNAASVTTSVTEGTATLDLTVVLSAKSGRTVTVDFARDATSTAVSPGDFTFSTTSPLTFLPGEDTKTITLAITNDGIGELDETLKVVLSNQTNANLPAGTATSTITISDDDCHGTGSFKVCPPSAAAGNITLTGTLDTTSGTGSASCGALPLGWTTTLGQDDACVIYAAKITVPAAGLTVTGNRPLVLFASSDILIQGTLDASAVNQTNGPGANAPSTCAAFPTAPQSNSAGGGGGAGASFMSKGGNGGKGDNGGRNGGTSPNADAADPTKLRGGCKGQDGGNGGSNTKGIGGGGGGAVYAVAGGNITITGAIDVSGGPGSGGSLSRGGGGGAGSGGMILLDAAGNLTANGVLMANGAGAGQGADGDTNGGAGGNPAIGNPTTPALGGNLNNAGGAGGNGFAGATDATTGTQGGSNQAGGGGGGGGGFIKGNAPLGGTNSAGKILP